MAKLEKQDPQRIVLREVKNERLRNRFEMRETTGQPYAPIKR